MSLVLHGFPFSTFTWSARLALAEKGVPYTVERPRFADPAYTRLHPWTKMPVLVHDGFVVFEATAVMRYVDEAFDGPALQPADARGRARMTQWMSAVCDYVAPQAVRRVLIPRLVLAGRGVQPDEASVARASAAARDALGRFEAVLADRPWLAGEAPTLADWLLAPILANDSALPETDRYSTGLPRLQDWLGRLSARPSWVASMG